jgi:hypothetical protein
MKADWFVLAACASFVALLMSINAPESADQQAVAPTATDLSEHAAEPIPVQSDCSTNCSPNTTHDERSQQNTLPNPDDCSSVPQYLQAECASALRDRAGDAQIEGTLDEPAE